MKEIIWKPELHRFSSCKEFVEEFRLGASDLILTNEYIYQPYFGAMNLECAVLYQEQYGMGEPTDVMAEAILRDAAATGCNRVVAIGGGTVIDIAKVLAVGGGDIFCSNLFKSEIHIVFEIDSIPVLISPRIFLSIFYKLSRACCRNSCSSRSYGTFVIIIESQ